MNDSSLDPSGLDIDVPRITLVGLGGTQPAAPANDTREASGLRRVPIAPPRAHVNALVRDGGVRI